jgi:hypothetical protein
MKAEEFQPLSSIWYMCLLANLRDKITISPGTLYMLWVDQMGELTAYVDFWAGKR